MGVGDGITAAGVSGMVAKIDEECTRRGIAGMSWVPNVGDLVYASEFNDIKTKNDAIDADHCYCEGDGDIETHNGGTTLVQSASAVSVGVLIYADDFTERDDDIDALAAQCAEVSCSCISDCSQCTCNTNVCTCNAHCSSVCTCNNYCICNFVCTCNIDGKVPSYACTCEGNCTCNTHCSSVCTCNKLCTCVSNCVTECTCNTQCTCEFD
jgi:hypothetical protein